MDERLEPRQIRKIGFGYALDFMPAPLVVGYHQFAKKIVQAGFKVKVALVPLNEVTADFDLLFVPKELASGAAEAISSERIITLTEFVNTPVYADLIRQLEEGKKIFAQRVDPNTKDEEDLIVRYRGYDRID